MLSIVLLILSFGAEGALPRRRCMRSEEFVSTEGRNGRVFCRRGL
jgi:hypothetical protein